MSMQALLPIFVALAAALVLPGTGDALQEERLQPALATRLKRIEAAFRQNDAASLRPSLTTTGKVRVDLHDQPEGQGSYGPGQLQVVFGRIFQDSPTQEFGFGTGSVTVSAPGTAFARGRWLRRGTPPGRADTLTFTLREDSGDWRISEIRSSR